MGDSTVTVIAIFLVAILMFMFPLMSTAERNDDISQVSVQKEVVEYVDKIRKTGKITLDEYDKFVQTISVGNKYDVEFEIQVAGENPGKKTVQAEITKNGEGLYYRLQTSQVMSSLQGGAAEIKLKPGDIVSVKVVNVNETLAQSVKNWIFALAGNKGNNISGQHSGVVLENGATN